MTLSARETLALIHYSSRESATLIDACDDEKQKSRNFLAGSALIRLVHSTRELQHSLKYVPTRVATHVARLTLK